jgi:hypothetical protein
MLPLNAYWTVLQPEPLRACLIYLYHSLAMVLVSLLRFFSANGT